MSENLRGRQSSSDAPDIGGEGEGWFIGALPRGWIWQRPYRDVGKDFLVVVHDRTELHNLEFSVQVKTSERPKIRDGSVVVSGVSRSSIRYWFAGPLPTLVVAVDISTRTGWYAWHLDLVNSPEELFGTGAESFTIRIPQTNELNDAGWSSIRKALLQHYGALQRALSTDAIASHVFATVYNVARIVGNLIRLDSGAPPQPPLTKNEGIQLLIEQIELRDLIRAVRSMVNRLVAGSEAHKQIAFWLMSFEEMATAGHPSLRNLPAEGEDIPADFELAVAPKPLLEVRPRLVLAAVDLIKLLTSPGPHTE